jgi:hypothetical protein
MLNARNVFRWISLAGAAGASMLVSRQASATNWVVGTVQYASTYWTGIEATFTVPSAPQTTTGQESFAIWPGLQGQDGTLLQPVLEWNEAGSGSWWMQNWFIPGNGGQRQDQAPVQVQPGDYIEAFVALDTNNPGSRCNLSTGNNCNYYSEWLDWTAYTGGLPYEWTMPVGPRWALGSIVEAPFSSYSSCSDFPLIEVAQVTNYLWQWSPSAPFTQVTPNFSVGYPGHDASFTFTNVSITSGGNLYPNCLSITYPWQNNYTSTVLW